MVTIVICDFIVQYDGCVSCMDKTIQRIQSRVLSDEYHVDILFCACVLPSSNSDVRSQGC